MGKQRRGGGRGGGDGEGGGRGGRGGFSGREDQYGEFQAGDRDDAPPPSQKGGGTGGGSAGGKKGSNMDLNYQRQVPKFLQRYAHMLGAKGGGGGDQQSEDDPVMVGPDGMTPMLPLGDGMNKKRHRDDDDDDDDGEEGVEADALRRAMADNPELAKEFEGKLNKKLNQAASVEEKERGNRLFGEKKYKDAVQSFTKCIELDPENEVFYSNRSASYASLPTPDYDAALADAKKACSLKPSWAKAYSRLGAAYFGLKLYSEAKEAYEKATKIEPDDQVLQRAYEKAEMLEMQQALGNKHTFKKVRTGGGEAAGKPPVQSWAAKALGGGAAVGGDAVSGSAKSGKEAAVNGGKKSLLSFAIDDEEGV